MAIAYIEKTLNLIKDYLQANVNDKIDTINTEKQNANVVLYNTLGSATEVQNSEIGANGVITGSPTYAACKFGNGININENNEYVQFTHTLQNTKGCIEFFFKPNFASTSATITVILFYGGEIGGGYYGIRWNTNATDRFYFEWPGSGKDADAFTFSSGDVMHIALTYNQSGIKGTSDTVKFFINGNEHGSTTTTVNNNSASNIRLGANSIGTFNANGIIDNFKVHNTDKIDFSDINNPLSNVGVSTPNIQNINYSINELDAIPNFPYIQIVPDTTATEIPGGNWDEDVHSIIIKVHNVTYSGNIYECAVSSYRYARAISEIIEENRTLGDEVIGWYRNNINFTPMMTDGTGFKQEIHINCNVRTIGT